MGDPQQRIWRTVPAGAVQSISKALAEAGYTARWDWYNLHGSVRDGE